jgi:amidase
VHADEEQLAILGEVLQLIEDAGATIINETEILNYETIVSPDYWDWDWGTRRGFPNESEYTVVKVDFYNNINAYLSELENTNIKTFDDIVQYNFDNTGTEGGYPMPDGHPAFNSGQDGFLASLATGGVKDETYNQALEFCQTSSRNGIDSALTYNGMQLDGLLVPPDVGQSYQISAQAGYPIITVPAGVHSESGMPFGLAILQTAYGEPKLVKYGSAIEDLLLETEYKRVLPKWLGYLERNLPVPF